MKKIFLIIITLITSLFLNSCSQEKKIVNNKYYSTWLVFTWNLDISNSFLWDIKWTKMVDLSTKSSGKVIAIYKKEWDLVSPWDIILKLDSSESKAWYSASDDILDSLYDLRNSTKSMFDEQILAMNEKISQAEIWKVWTNLWVEDTLSITNSQIEISKKSLESARLNLSNKTKVLETKEENIYSNSKDSIVSAFILDTNIINFIDNILGLRDETKNKNDSFEDYLSAKEKSHLYDAKKEFLESYESFQDFKEFYEWNIEWQNISRENILLWLDKAEIVAENLKILLWTSYDVFDNSLPSSSLDQTTLDNYKKVVSDFWVSIESSLLTVSGEYVLGIKWSKQNISDFEKSKQMELDFLQKQLEIAEASLSQSESVSKSQVNHTQTQNDLAESIAQESKIWLETLIKQKETKLNEIDSKIAEVKWQKKLSWAGIESWIIRSPISWVVTKIDADLWQFLSAWYPVINVTNKDKLKLTVSVTDDIYEKIVVWDEVVVEVTWVLKQVKANILNIYPSKDLVSKRYLVDISFENTDNIKVGSYWKVMFNISWNTWSILVSNDAIVSKFMVPWVYVLKDGIVTFKNIEIINFWDNFSDIKGLQVWEVVITSWKENIWDGEILK